MKSAKTKQALSSLDWAIAQTIELPQQPDEFTAYEFAEKAGVSLPTAKYRLKACPGIQKRTTLAGGCRVNLYKRTP